MSDFTVLPVWGGAGDWHFNRYRAVFKRPSHTNKQLLGGGFVSNFPKYVESRYATVQMTDMTYATMPTFHFHGYKYVPIPIITGLLSVDVDVARPHTDWVVKIDDNDNLGFTAQTLKREFRDLFEDLPTRTGDAIGLMVSPLLHYAATRFDDLMEVNRMHFLAGRRSWRVDDGKNFEVDGDVLVVETTAVERFSHRAYVRADTVAGMEKAVPDVWIAMLNNFLKLNGLDRVSQPGGGLGWHTKDGIDYYVSSYGDIEGLARDKEYAQQKRLGLFKTLLPGR
jgi:hypothetical protein